MTKQSIKRLGIAFVLFSFILIGFNAIYASSISLSATATSLTVGNSATLTITGNDAIGKVNISSSNSNIVSVSSSSLWIEGSSSVKITAKSVGTATITISPIDMANGSGNTASVPAKTITIYSNAVYVDTRSKNNYLETLSVEGYTIDFNKDVEDYSLDIPYTVDSINVNASPSDNKSSVEVTANSALMAGENITRITVTAENGDKKEYRIKVTREKNPEDINANLKTIYISNATLKDEFTKDVLEYMCEDVTMEINKLLISAQTEIEDAKVEITGNDELKFGLNHIIIKVTSKDESVTKEYNIYVYKKNEVNPLIELENKTGGERIMDWLKQNKLIVLCLGVILILLIVILILIIRNIKQRKRTYLEAPENNSENITTRRRRHEIDNAEDTTSVEEQEENKENSENTQEENREIEENTEELEDEVELNENEIDNDDTSYEE